MSALFFMLDTEQRRLQPALAEKMFGCLDHFGVDGKELVIRDNFAVGYQRHWTVPEEQGECQPLHCRASGTWLVFYGRVDNRKTLLKALNAERPAEISDAVLVHAFLNQFGAAGLEKIIGPFALVYFDPAENKVLVARDCMGGRYLSYHYSKSCLVISSFDLALAAHPKIGYRLRNEKRLRLLANVMEDQPSSTLENITPLLPGHSLQLRNKQLKLEKFYLPDPSKRIELMDNKAYAIEFRRLLDQAVQRRSRSILPVGVMLSGGLDSVPIAISASLNTTKGAMPEAYSWIFDLHKDSDEREISSQVCEQFRLHHHLINCDQIWPKLDGSAYINPTLPYISPFNEFNRVLFETAHQRGTGVLLSGIGGDMLYSGSGQLLLELLFAGRFRDAWRETRSLYKLYGNWRKFIKQHLLLPFPLFSKIVARRTTAQAQKIKYLTAQAQSVLQLREHWLKKEFESAVRPDQYRNVVDAFEGEDANYGKYLEADYHLERRYPLRDRELVEFMLAIPSDQLFSLGVHRPVVKRAFMDEFSGALNQRNSKTNFNPVIDAGILNDTQVKQWLGRDDALWRQDVKDCYFDSVNAHESHDNAVKWRCAYYEFWQTLCYTPKAIELGLNNE